MGKRVENTEKCMFPCCIVKSALSQFGEDLLHPHGSVHMSSGCLASGHGNVGERQTVNQSLLIPFKSHSGLTVVRTLNKNRSRWGCGLPGRHRRRRPVGLCQQVMTSRASCTNLCVCSVWCMCSWSLSICTSPWGPSQWTAGQECSVQYGSSFGPSYNTLPLVSVCYLGNKHEGS